MCCAHSCSSEDDSFLYGFGRETVGALQSSRSESSVRYLFCPTDPSGPPLRSCLKGFKLLFCEFLNMQFKGSFIIEPTGSRYLWMKPVRPVSLLRRCDRRRFPPGEKREEVEPAAALRRRALHLSPPACRRAENNSSAERKRRGFYPSGGAGDRGPPLTARRRLFMEAPTCDPADCMLSGNDYLPTETCFYILPAPVSREDRQRLTDGVDPGR